MDIRLLLLAGGAFAIGTGSLVITGILPNLAAAFGVSIDTAGLLISIFAIAYAIGSPVLSTLLGNAERKLVLVGSLTLFTLANLLAAFTSDFSSLMLARIVMALASGVFMPAANAVAVAPRISLARAVS